MMARKSPASHRSSSPKLYPTAARTPLMRSPARPMRWVPVHAVLGLEVADDGLGRCATLYLAPDGSCDAADLTRDPAPEPMRVVVAAAPLVEVDCG